MHFVFATDPGADIDPPPECTDAPLVDKPDHASEVLERLRQI